MTPSETLIRSVRPYLALVAVTALAAAFFLFRIGAPSLWFDETFSVDTVKGGFDLIDVNRGIEVSGMAVYYALLEQWIRVSLDEGWIRLLSAIAAIAAVPTTWLLTRRLFDARIATTAAVLLVLNPFTIRYAQEARSYSLLLLLGVVSTYLLVRAVQHPTWKAWIAYGVVVALIPYTHVLGATLLLVHALAALMYAPRPPLARMILAAAIVGVALVPMALSALRNADAAVGWIPRPSLGWITDQLLRIGGGVAEGPNAMLRPIIGGTALLLVVAGMVVAAGVVASRRRSWSTILVLSWFVVPVVLSIAVSFAKPMFVSRYLIASLPAFAILGAFAIDAIPSVRWRAGLLAVVLVVALVGVRAYHVDHGRADWRGVASYLDRRGAEGDRWLVDPTWSWRPVLFYVDRDHDRAGFPERLWRGLNSTDPSRYAVVLGRTAEELAGEGRTIWVVVTGATGGTSRVLADPRYAPFRELYRLAETRTFNRVTVFRFLPIVVAADARRH